jgi:phosphomannomutase
LSSAIILKEHRGSTIVTDSITSKGLTEFIEKELGGKHHRFKRGYKNVINEAVRLNNQGEEAWLAIETSGHAALKENYFLDDGAFLVAKILMEIANMKKENKSVGDLIKNLKRPKESKEFRIKITGKEFKNYGNIIIEELTKLSNKQNNWSIETPNYEGVRVNCNTTDEKGWFLLRLSLHDPVLPLNIESDIENGVKVIASKLIDFFKSFENIVITETLYE